eukprot:324027-Chlamydomonas_euryale.AAC.1
MLAPGSAGPSTSAHVNRCYRTAVPQAALHVHVHPPGAAAAQQRVQEGLRLPAALLHAHQLCVLPGACGAGGHALQ